MRNRPMKSSRIVNTLQRKCLLKASMSQSRVSPPIGKSKNDLGSAEIHNGGIDTNYESLSFPQVCSIIHA